MHTVSKRKFDFRAFAFFEILTLKQLGRHKKPIAVLNIRGYFDALEELLEGAVEEGFLEKEDGIRYPNG